MILMGFIGLLYLVVGIVLWQLIWDMSTTESSRTRLKGPASTGQDCAEQLASPVLRSALREDDEPYGNQGIRQAQASDLLAASVTTEDGQTASSVQIPAPPRH